MNPLEELIGAGPYQSDTTNWRGLVYTVWEIGKGKLWLFPSRQAEQIEEPDLVENGILLSLRICVTIFEAEWPSLLCHRSKTWKLELVVSGKSELTLCIREAVQHVSSFWPFDKERSDAFSKSFFDRLNW